MKVVENSPQNAQNCTNFKNFPNPPSKGSQLRCSRYAALRHVYKTYAPESMFRIPATAVQILGIF